MTSEPASTPSADDLLLLTPEEAARRLSIGRTRLYSLLRTGHIASIQIGGSRRITPNALRDYVASVEDDHEVDQRPAVSTRSANSAAATSTRPLTDRGGRSRAVAGAVNNGGHRIEAPRLPLAADD